jgi:hypothetical protein
MLPPIKATVHVPQKKKMCNIAISIDHDMVVVYKKKKEKNQTG